jgi:hypothetical protein
MLQYPHSGNQKVLANGWRVTCRGAWPKSGIIVREVSGQEQQQSSMYKSNAGPQKVMNLHSVAHQTIVPESDLGTTSTGELEKVINALLEKYGCKATIYQHRRRIGGDQIRVWKVRVSLFSGAISLSGASGCHEDSVRHDALVAALQILALEVH